MNKATAKLTLEYLALLFGSAILSFCLVMVVLKACEYIDPVPSVEEVPRPEYTSEEPFMGYIDANETTVVVQTASKEPDGSWYYYGITNEYGLWEFNDEGSGVMKNGGDIAMINALIHRALEDPAVRADLVRHGYVDAEDMNDLLLMFPDEFSEGYEGRKHVPPALETESQ